MPDCCFAAAPLRMPPTCSSTPCCRTPPTVRYCAHGAGKCMPASQGCWNSGFRTSSKPGRRLGLGRRNSSLVRRAHRSVATSGSGEGRGVVPHRPCNRPQAGHTGLRIARGHEPRPPLGREEPAGRGARAARARLRLVHRRLRHTRSERGKSVEPRQSTLSGHSCCLTAPGAVAP